MAAPDAPVATTSRSPARPDVLGYPSPTTSRYLVFVTALLAAGLFVGNWLHLQLLGDQWEATVRGCQEAPTVRLEGFLAAHEREVACMAGAERTRTGFALGGAVFVALAGATVLFLSPVVVKRRRRLRPLKPELDGARHRFDELAGEAGVSGRVAPLTGPSTLRDAFSFGRPGRYAVALPLGVVVRWRDRSLFDPLVRHELAHARHGDVALAWLTRSVWYALAPVLLLPILWGAASGDAGLVGSYSWRAALLAAVVALLSADLLRSREYAADLRAARWTGDPAPVAALVGRARNVPAAGPRRLVANHPTPQERQSVLHVPATLTRTGFVDGLVGAFLAALAMPLLVRAVSPAMADRALTPYVIAALVLGPLLGTSVGSALWRAALVARVGGHTVAGGMVAAGVAAGLVLGAAASLDRTGLGRVLGVQRPGWLLVGGLAAAGATLLSAGLATCWADVTPRLRGFRTAWFVALAVNAILYSALLWAAFVFQAAVDSGGWTLGKDIVTTTLASWPMFGVALGAAVAAGVPLCLRLPQVAPGWLLEAPSDDPWPAAFRPSFRTVLATAAAGAAGASAVVVGYRLVQGPTTPALSFERYLSYQWVIAVGAAAAGLVAVAADRHRAAATALAAGPLAAAAGTVAFVVLNESVGGSTTPTLVLDMLRPAVVTGFYLVLVLAPLAYAAALGVAVVSRRSLRSLLNHRGGVVAACALTLAVVAGSLALQQRAHLVGFNPLTEETATAEGTLAEAATDYVVGVVAPLTDEYEALAGAAATIDQDPTLSSSDRAAALEQAVVVPLRALVSRWAQLQIAADPVREVHRAAVEALGIALAKYALLAEAYRRGDPALLERVRALHQEEAAWWQEWFDRRQALAASVTGG